MTPDAFFTGLAPWSVYKHIILEKYVRMWVYKLSHTARALAFVDTCAGAGRYADGSPGSPLIAAQWNGYLTTKGAGRLVVHACEQDPETVQSLRRSLAPYLAERPPLAVVYNAAYYEVMPQILAATRGCPALFFIDPYGLSDLTAERIGPILKDRSRRSTEVIARIDPVLLARFAGWLRKRERNPKQERTAASFRALLERLNVDTVELQASLDEDPTGIASHPAVLLDAYLELFNQRFQFVQLIPIRPSYFAAPKYFLVHGTDSPHGAALINDAVSTTEDTLFANSVTAGDRARGQVSMFDPEPRAPRYTVTLLTQRAMDIVEGEGPMRFIELRARLALTFGPDFREKDHKRVVKHLVAAGRLRPLTAGSLTDGTLLQRS